MKGNCARRQMIVGGLGTDGPHRPRGYGARPWRSRCPSLGQSHIGGVTRQIDMTARMNNPANVLPDSMTAIQSVIKAAYSAGVPQSTMQLAHLRASQVNGCSPCVYSGAISAQKAGESDERLFAVAAWRETELFTEAERAALALAESMTRLADRPDPVPDEILGRGGKALRREAARRTGPVGRHDQSVQPAQRHDQAACRRRVVTVGPNS